MLLHELMLARRDEILHACQEELEHADGLSDLGRYECAKFLHRAGFPAGEWLELSDAGAPLRELEARIVALRRRTSPQAALGLTVYIPDVAASSEPIQCRVAALLQEQSLPLRVVASRTPGIGKPDSNTTPVFANQVELTPLRERLEDLGELTRYLAERSASRPFGAPTSFGASAIERMQAHSWPGNVRELYVFVARLSAQFGDRTLTAADLPEPGTRTSDFHFTLPTHGIDLTGLERDLLSQALGKAHGDETRAASLLGLTRDQFRSRVGKLGIPCDP